MAIARGRVALRSLVVAVATFALLLGGAGAAHAATLTVNDAGDNFTFGNGQCTLREALLNVQLNVNLAPECGAPAAPNTIVFAIGAVGSSQTITLGGFGSLIVAATVTVDGLSQGGPGYTGPPLIEINGAGLGIGQSGFVVTGAAASNSTVQGFTINRAPGFGIAVAQANNVKLYGNYIGTNPAGTTAQGNTLAGISVSGPGVTTTTIGGPAAGQRNIISSNGQGATNLGGIYLSNTVSGTTIQNNYIGVGANGTTALGNTGPGVNIDGTTGAITTTTVGGATASLGNIIANNTLDGISVIAAASTGNQFRANSIFSNGGLGIDLLNDGVTANDVNDGDAGPNNLQNFPVLTSARTSNGTTRVAGTLNSSAATAFTIDFYSNASCDASGNGEGQTFLGSTVVNTTGNNATISATGLAGTTAGNRVTATATDPAGNTSEFSACATVVEDPGTSSAPGTVTEPATGTTPLTFTVTLAAASADTATVNFATQNGPAGNTGATGGTACGTTGVDFVNTNGTLTFNPGETTKTVTVTVCADTVDELTETFSLVLSNPVNTTLTTTTLTGTILDLDVTPCATTLQSAIPAGTTVLPTFSQAGCNVGDRVAINLGAPNEDQGTITGFGSIIIDTPTKFAHAAGEPVVRISQPVVLQVAPAQQNPEDDTDKPKKETEEERQQRLRTNRTGRADVTIEGNVLLVEKAADGKSQLVTIGLTRGETQIVQVPCFSDGNCHDIRVGDYLEADGYQNGVGDPNTYFVASDGIEVTRNGKRVK